MNTAVRKWNARARTGQSASRVLFVATTFAGLLAGAAMIGYRLVAPEKPIPREQYRGVIELAPDERGQCERFEFDNRTGSIRRQGTASCSVETPAPAAATGSSSPFRGVRDYFRPR
jgi:hypothetical protein